MGVVKDLYSKPEDLTTTKRKRSLGYIGGAVVFLIVVALLIALPAIWRTTEEIWVYVGLALPRLAAACVAFAFSVGVSYPAYQWIENTQFGLDHPDDRGLVYIACLIGACLVFARVVL